MERLDQDILDWIAAHNPSEALAKQLATVSVKRRDYTRTGFFLYLQSDASLPAVETGYRIRCPHIDSPGLPDGAGCGLFLRGGHLHYLEVYARGGFMPEHLADYRLVAEEG